MPALPAHRPSVARSAARRLAVAAPVLSLLTMCVLVFTPSAQAQTPLRLTDADLPLLQEYLAIDAASLERETQRQTTGMAVFDREMATYEADQASMRRKIRSGELDQLALLHDGGSTGLLVPDGTTYDIACSRQHDVDPGFVVYKGSPTGGGDAAKAQVAAWIQWYATKGYGSDEAYTKGTTLIGPATRQKEPREVSISIALVDESCDDLEPRVHVNGWHGAADQRDATIQRFDQQLKAADTLAPLPTAEETLATRGIDPTRYVARRDALLAAYLTRTFSEVEWAASAEGESAAVRAELAARRANVSWLLGPGQALLPLLRRYAGS